MVVRRFTTDDYPTVAELSSVDEVELRARDASSDGVLRWVALEEHRTVAAATAALRPDDRLFVRFAGRIHAYGALAQAVRDALGRSVHAIVGESDEPQLAVLANAGFVTEVVTEDFRVAFADALAVLHRSGKPSWAHIVPADAVDEERLFQFDNEVRNDVPGTDGWGGNRAWFREELSEAPPFDPDGYLVAIDSRNDDYVGLVRIWRNPDAPRFGLVGVRRTYRRTTIAAALIRRALIGASQWGYDTFVTVASLTNPVTHPRLARLACERLGRSHQLVLR